MVLVIIIIILAGLAAYGLFIRSSTSLEVIEFTETKVGCIYNAIDKEFIINSEEEYKSLYDKFLDPGCVRHFPDIFNKPFEITEIDFSEKTLLGKHTYGEGCSIDFERAVLKDTANMKIIFEITVIEKGLCSKAGVSYNFITILKVSPDYSIEFKVKR